MGEDEEDEEEKDDSPVLQRKDAREQLEVSVAGRDYTAVEEQLDAEKAVQAQPEPAKKKRRTKHADGFILLTPRKKRRRKRSRGFQILSPSSRPAPRPAPRTGK